MSYSSAQIAPSSAQVDAAEREAGGWRIAVLLGAVALLWFEVVNHLRIEWDINPQYSYGWTVPFLALYLFFRRWSDRPAPAAPRWPVGTIVLALLSALPFLPARIISIANPDWRLLSWSLAVGGVLITFCLLNLSGGIPWLKHFAFPVLFILVGTPWPAQLEQQIVLGLMRADAAIVVEVLNAIGTVAIQRGNVIELSTGIVGIEDACTGVRSLQSTFMIALFLGEFYRMSGVQRVLLVVLAAVIAFVCNLIRTLILCLVAASSGVEAVHSWHDSAGFGILGVCLVALWLVSLWFTRGRQVAETGTPAPNLPAGFFSRSTALALALVVCFLFTETAAAAWYKIRGAERLKQPSWTAVWPEQAANYKALPVAEEVENLLLYNEGGSASWKADGREWLMYYFRWLPGRTAALFVKVHRPDVCLPASGLTMRSQSPLDVMAVDGVQLPYRIYRFEGGGQTLDVFYSYWDGRSSYTDAAAAESEDWSARGRLRAAWNAQREIGARMLEIAVWGYEDEARARDALLREAQALIKRG